MRVLRPASLLFQRSRPCIPLVRSSISTAISSQSFSVSAARPALGPPVNLDKWIENNADKLKPPVNNKVLQKDDNVIVMVVGGPNARTDYHVNETAEWFLQRKGSMLLKVIDDGEFKDIHIHEGCAFLLPANMPHNPVRYANTVGIVIEQARPEGSVDRLRWYCQNCNEQVHEASFHCTDLGTQIKEAIVKFKADKEARTCKNCGTLCDTEPPKPKS